VPKNGGEQKYIEVKMADERKLKRKRKLRKLWKWRRGGEEGR
jgi:hypothetical protein